MKKFNLIINSIPIGKIFKIIPLIFDFYNSVKYNNYYTVKFGFLVFIYGYENQDYQVHERYRGLLFIKIAHCFGKKIICYVSIFWLKSFKLFELKTKQKRTV